MQTNQARWPFKFFLTAVVILIILTLTFNFNGSFDKHQSSVGPVATSTVQTIETGTDKDGMEDEHAFLQADYNFDGIPDRLKMLDCGASGNCSYEVDLYDAKTKTYLPTVDATVTNVVQEPGADGDITFEVTNPEVNKSEKLVCSFANVGSGTYHMGVYKYSAKNNGSRPG